MLTFLFLFLDSHSLYPALRASDESRFQSLTQALDLHNQALANAVFQHAEQRRVEIEKEKLEKASGAVPPSWLVAERILLLKFWNTYFFSLAFHSSRYICVVKELRQAWIEFCVGSLIWASHFTNIRENSGTWKDSVLEPVVWTIYLVLAIGCFVF